MSPNSGYGNAQVTLARHGLDPAMDVERLEAAIAARGWRVAVERVDGGARGDRRRYRALATESDAPPPWPARPASRSTTGATVQHVLVTVLAKVLEFEERRR